MGPTTIWNVTRTMNKAFFHWFSSSPIGDDEEQKRVAQLLYKLLLVCFGSIVLFIGAILLLKPANNARLFIVYPLPFLIVALLFFMRRGYVKLTSYLFSVLIWLTLMVSGFNNGGVHSEAYSLTIVAVLITSFLCGSMIGIVLAFLNAIGGIVMLTYEWQSSHELPLVEYGALELWVIYTISTVIGAFIIHLANRSISKAFARVQESETILREKHHHLAAQTIAFRDSEEKLRSIMENAPALIIITNRAGEIQFVNRQLSDHITANGPVLIYDYVEPVYVDTVRQTVEKVFETGEPGTYEVLRLQEGERRVWYSTKVGPIWQEGQVVAATFISTEVTELKRAEEEKVEHLNKLLALYKASLTFAQHLDIEPVGEMVIETLDNLLSWQRGSIWLLNETHDELRLLAHSRGELSPQAYQQELARVRRIINQPGQGICGWVALHGEAVRSGDIRTDPRYIAASPAIRSELCVPIKIAGRTIGALNVESEQRNAFDEADERLLSILASQAAVAIENSHLFEMIQQELHEKKLAESALRESEERYRTLVEQAVDGIFIANAQGQVVDVNTSGHIMLGYTRQEILQRTIADISVLDELGDAPWPSQELVTGEPILHELQLKQKDGTLLPVEVNAKQLPDGRLLGIARDITQRKQLEAQFHQAQKMEAIGQLTAGIAHDFNNLLIPIVGYTELLQLRLSPDSPYQTSLEKIMYAAQDASNLIRQLLAFSSRQVIDLQLLDLNSIVVETKKLLQRLLGEKIQLQTVLAAEPLTIKADPTQIKQIIINLAVNARDAMPSGGQLTIETATVYLDEAYVAHHVEAQTGNYICLSVHDTGIGMSEEVKAHIFEPFFTTKGQGKGTGLGLATVHGIVKQCGGYLWVESEADDGTTFQIYLPHIATMVPASPATEDEAEIMTGNETILLVEDDDEVRAFVKQALMAQGYNVLETNGGEEALRLITHCTDDVHLLVTDVVMPGINGTELAERLSSSIPTLKVLFISGYDDSLIAQHRLLTNDSPTLLQKPFGPKALTQKVRKVLDS